MATSERDVGSLDPTFGIGNGDEMPIRQMFNALVGPPDGTLNVKVHELQ